jgi:uncharacterized protein YbjT (DUF2867 family)
MILIAGGTGFIGSAVARALINRRQHVAVMTHRLPAGAETPQGDDPAAGSSVRWGDVARPETLAAAVSGCDTVVNAVQFPNYPSENPSRGYTFEEIDQRGTERLVAAARDAGVRRFIYISGVGASPDAAKHWFRAKWAAEQAVRQSGMTYTIFRPTWVYGPGDHALNRLVEFAHRLPVVPIIGDGTQRLQPIFVDDLAACVAESLTRPAAENRLFEVGGPQVLTMNEIVRTMLEVMGKSKRPVHAPASAMQFLARIVGRLPHAPLSPEIVSFATVDAVTPPGAGEEIEQLLGVKLTPLRAGLATYLQDPRAPSAGAS